MSSKNGSETKSPRKACKSFEKGDKIGLVVRLVSGEVTDTKEVNGLQVVTVSKPCLRQVYKTVDADGKPVEKMHDVLLTGSSIDDLVFVIHAERSQRFLCPGLSSEVRQKLSAAPAEQRRQVAMDLLAGLGMDSPEEVLSSHLSIVKGGAK